MVTGIAPTVAHAWIDRQLAFWSPAWVLGGCALAVAVALVVRAPLARWAPARRRLLLLAAVPPIIVEGAQLAVRSLNRVCEGSDIVTKWLGLLPGYAVVRTAVRVSRRGPHDEEPGSGGPTVSNGQRSTSSPSTASTVTVSPSATLPSRICIASVSASSRWMTRLSGRAPNAGS
jgi:hypothetical protein